MSHEFLQHENVHPLTRIATLLLTLGFLGGMMGIILYHSPIQWILWGLILTFWAGVMYGVSLFIALFGFRPISRKIIGAILMLVGIQVGIWSGYVVQKELLLWGAFLACGAIITTFLGNKLNQWEHVEVQKAVLYWIIGFSIFIVGGNILFALLNLPVANYITTTIGIMLMFLSFFI